MTAHASFCTGIGGLDHAVQDHYGTRLAWYAEVDSAACGVLERRYPDVPNVGDITGRAPSPVRPGVVGRRRTRRRPLCRLPVPAVLRRGLTERNRRCPAPLALHRRRRSRPTTTRARVGERRRAPHARLRRRPRRPCPHGVRCTVGRCSSIRRRRTSSTCAAVRRCFRPRPRGTRTTARTRRRGWHATTCTHRKRPVRHARGCHSASRCNCYPRQRQRTRHAARTSLERHVRSRAAWIS